MIWSGCERCSSGRLLNPATCLWGIDILGTDARLSTVIPFTGVGNLELASDDT
jgi:hypothetical protein